MQLQNIRKCKKVANGEVTNLTATDGDTITLYAQWEKTTPTIRVKINNSIVTGLFYIKANNAIHLVSEAYVKVNGVWKQIE